MARMGFGAFLAPHHPIGENPTLQFRRDLKFVEHLDELGYDEFCRCRRTWSSSSPRRSAPRA